MQITILKVYFKSYKKISIKFFYNFYIAFYITVLYYSFTKSSI